MDILSDGAVTFVVALLMAVGLVGIVLPIIPGSPLIAIATLLWAVNAGTGAAWAVFAVVLVLLALGWSATYVLTGARVAASGVPKRSMVLAGLAGVVGFFVIPVLGLFLFFALGLYLAERRRLSDPLAARRSAALAIKATLLGMAVELGLAVLAVTTWAVAHFGFHAAG